LQRGCRVIDPLLHELRHPCLTALGSKIPKQHEQLSPEFSIALELTQY
jgi:hypothetical protein